MLLCDVWVPCSFMCLPPALSQGPPYPPLLMWPPPLGSWTPLGVMSRSTRIYSITILFSELFGIRYSMCIIRYLVFVIRILFLNMIPTCVTYTFHLALYLFLKIQKKSSRNSSGQFEKIHIIFEGKTPCLRYTTPLFYATPPTHKSFYASKI